METALAPSEPRIGFIIREREPVNFEYFFDQLDTFLTPNDPFYIRSHFKVPVSTGSSTGCRSAARFRMRLRSTMKSSWRCPLSLAPLRWSAPATDASFWVPQVKGAQWQLGAVSTAEWTGCPSLRCWNVPALIRVHAKSSLRLPTRCTQGGANSTTRHLLLPQSGFR